VITGGTASTTALAGSTEAEQFHEAPPPVYQQTQPIYGAAND
jgi:hypothetical protein